MYNRKWMRIDIYMISYELFSSANARLLLIVYNKLPPNFNFQCVGKFYSEKQRNIKIKLFCDFQP